jgi:hypothetical protein
MVARRLEMGLSGKVYFAKSSVGMKRDTFYDVQHEASNNVAPGGVRIHCQIPLPTSTRILRLTKASPSTPLDRFGRDFVFMRRLY